MAKTNGVGEKTKETHVVKEKTKETHGAGAKPAHAAGAKPPEGKSGEVKSPEAKSASGSSSGAVRGKGHTALPGHCFSWSCKAEADRFNFCKEHYEHFKFGLIKKTGEQVSDYEKKIGHYLAFKAKRGAQKVA